MSARIIDGKAVAAKVGKELKVKVERLIAAGRQPGLAVIIVGDNPASRVYVNNKKGCGVYVLNRWISSE